MSSIVIASSVDPCSSAHSRLHEIVRVVSLQHQVTILTVRETERGASADIDMYNGSSQEYIHRAREIHLDDSSTPMFLQEMLSNWLVRRHRQELADTDVLLDYNTFVSGRHAQESIGAVGQRRPIPRIYDLADQIPAMIDRVLPFQIGLRRMVSAVASHYLRQTLESAEFVTTTLPALPKNFSIESEKILHVPNGVDPELFQPIRQAEARRYLGIPEDVLVIGYAGVLRDWVNMEPVLQALRSFVQEDDCDITFITAGSEGNQGWLPERSRQLGLEKVVLNFGTVPYRVIPHFFSACDLSVVPFQSSEITHYAVPLKVLESFACGVPVAGSNLFGMRTTFGGTVIACETPESYLETFQELASNGAAIRQRGRQGLRMVTDHFSWSKVLRPLLQLIEQMS